MKGINGRYAESVIRQAMKGTLTTGQAAAKLSCTKQYVNRMKKRMAAEGAGCLVHGNMGKQRKWKTPEGVREKIVSAYRLKYDGLNFRHFLEKLNECEGVEIGYRPMYRILSDAGISSPRRQRRPHRKNLHPSRPRREGFGELIQIDASLHPWFGPDLPKATLHGGIDDATSTVMGLFFDREETLKGYYSMLREILLRYGIPEALYSDNRTIFEFRKLSEKDKTIDRDVHIQFRRCCSQLGIGIITTSVSQAKGRIERLWGTLQSRLVSELRIRGIRTIEEANAFLPEFTADFNRRFAIRPDMEKSLFAPAPSPKEINYYLSTEYRRKADGGSCLRMLGRRIQLMDGEGATVPLENGQEADVYVTFTGTVVAFAGGKFYATKDAELTKEKAAPVKRGRRPWKPGPDHPWRRYLVKYKSKG